MSAKPKIVSLNCLERHTSEGDSPVNKTIMAGLKRVGLPGLEV